MAPLLTVALRGSDTVTLRGSDTAAPKGRSRTAGLRRGVLLLAVVLTAVAGPLGRPASGAPSDEVLRPAATTSSTVAITVP